MGRMSPNLMLLKAQYNHLQLKEFWNVVGEGEDDDRTEVAPSRPVVTELISREHVIIAKLR